MFIIFLYEISHLPEPSEQFFAAASDQVYQLLVQGRWLSPASSITKSIRHDIAESGIKNQNSFIHSNFKEQESRQILN